MCHVFIQCAQHVSSVACNLIYTGCLITAVMLAFLYVCVRVHACVCVLRAEQMLGALFSTLPVWLVHNLLG